MSFCLVIIIQINLYQCPLNIFTLLNNTFTRSSTVRTLLNYSYKLQVSLIIQKKKKCNIRHLLHLVDQIKHSPLSMFHVILGSHEKRLFQTPNFWQTHKTYSLNYIKMRHMHTPFKLSNLKFLRLLPIFAVMVQIKRNQKNISWSCMEKYVGPWVRVKKSGSITLLPGPRREKRKPKQLFTISSHLYPYIDVCNVLVYKKFQGTLSKHINFLFFQPILLSYCFHFFLRNCFHYLFLMFIYYIRLYNIFNLSSNLINHIWYSIFLPCYK